MMRAFTSAARAAILLLPGLALADPAPPPAIPGPSLGQMATAAARAHAAPAKPITPTPRIDLTPRAIFAGRAAADRKGHERSDGIPLGDDSSWQAQAAEAGVMVGAFAALWALCGSGNCALPAASFLPDWMTTQEGSTADVRPEPQVRSGR